MAGIASQDAECPFLAQLAEFESRYSTIIFVSSLSVMVDGKCQIFFLVWINILVILWGIDRRNSIADGQDWVHGQVIVNCSAVVLPTNIFQAVDVWAMPSFRSFLPSFLSKAMRIDVCVQT